MNKLDSAASFKRRIQQRQFFKLMTYMLQIMFAVLFQKDPFMLNKLYSGANKFKREINYKENIQLFFQ
jgi:hypothetical protein